MSRRLVPRAKVREQLGYEWAAERWLVRQNSERRLPFHRVSGHVLIDLDDLDSFVEAGRVDAASSISLRALRSARRRAS